MTFQELRAKYNKIIFHGWWTERREGRLTLEFDYELVASESENDNIRFKHCLSLARRQGSLKNVDGLDGLILRIGVMELINYWKLACPAVIELKCGHLSDEEQVFWRKLIYKGLGEFIYLNRLHLPEVAGFVLTDKNIVEFVTNPNKKFERIELTDDLSGNLIAVGGGKDSVVSLEVLRNQKADNLPLIVNAQWLKNNDEALYGDAAADCVKIAGYDDGLEIDRMIDPKVMELNQQGFLNGHVPFSAILAFISVLGAVLTGKKNVVMSNESSANESSVPGTDFNHQYSKSVEFEADFRNFLNKFVLTGVEYFSLLRPLEELQIAELFSHYQQYHRDFRSCNVGKRTNTWCGRCPKCLFVFIMLAAFMDYSDVVAIFNKDLLADGELRFIFRQLLGLEETKPFECVGTVSEVRRAMRMIVGRNWSEADMADLPVLAQEFITAKLPDLAMVANEQHFVPETLLTKLIDEEKKYGLL